jgi:uncharacterized protein
MSSRLIRTVVWKNLLLNGADHCALWDTGAGWLLRGTVIGVLQDRHPVLANYEIHCDRNWLTQRVHIDRTIGSDVKKLSLSVEKRGTWNAAGEQLQQVEGCYDVDLALTPATNTLPIRRLKLRVGTKQAVSAAWVKFPDLTVEPLPQQYTRVSENTYQYESNTGFSAEIVVDDQGLVVAYPGGWERIAML